MEPKNAEHMRALPRRVEIPIRKPPPAISRLRKPEISKERETAYEREVGNGRSVTDRTHTRCLALAHLRCNVWESHGR